MRTRSLVSTIAAVGLLGTAGAALGDDHHATVVRTAGSTVRHNLPDNVSGHRPGPDILYAKPPRAPQLENRGVWKAPPILVSGAQAYREGEYIYQDYLFDDHGAMGGKDPNDPYGAQDHLYSAPQGTFTYPTSKVYANNAADLVEFRVKPLAKATAFRVTLDTLKDPSRTAFTIALGDAQNQAWPYAAGVSSPASGFLTWHGSSVDFLWTATDWNGHAVPYKATLHHATHVDLLRRQVTVLLPHRIWDPKQLKVRMSVGVGLWDRAAHTYLAPQPGPATATTPGGASADAAAIVNIGPRLDEPLPLIAGATMADTAVGGEALARFWRDSMQAQQLAEGDVSPFAADVDFAKLAKRSWDESDVPQTGPMDRIMASHYSFGQGVDPTKVCYRIGGVDLGAKCIGRDVGQLQPYAVYVPKQPWSAPGFGVTLLLHSLSANYNQYLGSHNQSELGDRGSGSIVITPGGRGPDGFYAGIPEADTFEAWADVARNYNLDPDWTVVTGYSMGGFGTYRLLARWPDLFARGWSVVGAPGSVDDQLVSLRNTPLLLWNSTEDELVNIQTSEQAVADDTAAGIRFIENLFLTADHLTLAANDEFMPGVRWLGSHRVDRDPARVSYVVDPTEDNALARTVADHAYWLSGLRTRGKGDGVVDAVSKAFGVGIPKVLPVQQGAGVLTGGEIPAMAYVQRRQAWGPTPKAPRADAIVITAKNLSRIVIDIARAHVDCNVTLKVSTDGPLTVVIPGCGEARHFR
jgi:hypothetical protein